MIENCEIINNISSIDEPCELFYQIVDKEKNTIVQCKSEVHKDKDKDLVICKTPPPNSINKSIKYCIENSIVTPAPTTLPNCKDLSCYKTNLVKLKNKCKDLPSKMYDCNLYYEMDKGKGKDKDKIYRCKKEGDKCVKDDKHTIVSPPTAASAPETPGAGDIILKEPIDKNKLTTINNILTGIYETRIKFHNL